jgi:hypothetical protein
MTTHTRPTITGLTEVEVLDALYVLERGRS